MGLLEPGEHCQAVVSSNSALLLALDGYFRRVELNSGGALPADWPGEVAPNEKNENNWLDWENRKQLRLWKNPDSQRIA